MITLEIEEHYRPFVELIVQQMRINDDKYGHSDPKRTLPYFMAVCNEQMGKLSLAAAMGNHEEALERIGKTAAILEPVFRRLK